MDWLHCSQNSQKGSMGPEILLGPAKLSVLAHNTMGKLINFCLKGMLLEGSFELFSFNG